MSCNCPDTIFRTRDTVPRIQKCLTRRKLVREHAFVAARENFRIAQSPHDKLGFFSVLLNSTNIFSAPRYRLHQHTILAQEARGRDPTPTKSHPFAKYDQTVPSVIFLPSRLDSGCVGEQFRWPRAKLDGTVRVLNFVKWIDFQSAKKTCAFVRVETKSLRGKLMIDTSRQERFGMPLPPLEWSGGALFI